MEFVEVEGKTVKIAVAAGLEELGIATEEEAEIEVLREPERGFLGFGGSLALVRVRPKPKQKRRRRGGRRRGRSGAGKEGEAKQPAGGGDDRQRGRDRGEGRPKQTRDRGRGARSGSRDQGRSDGGSEGRREGRKPRQPESASTGKPKKSGGGDRNRGSQQKGEPTMKEETAPVVDVEGQAEIIKDFLVGLLDAFGLEGQVDLRVEEGIVFAEVTGEQTEALVGSRGVILQSILELCRTVVQRKSHASARIRLDIAGYAERRREALRIYAARLADQVLADGEEVMLEPMNPADRKVVHDAVGEIEGVKTYSEGEEPNRSVVISLGPGVQPRGSAADSATEEAGDDEDEADHGDGERDEPTPEAVDDSGADDSGADDSGADDSGAEDEGGGDEATDEPDDAPEAEGAADEPADERADETQPLG